MTLEQAFAEFKQQVDLSVEPEISPTEAKACLERTKRYGDRAATPAFGSKIAVGARVYRCVWEGDTAETIPSALGRTCYGRRVSDGTATWEDIGGRPASEWDFNGAKWAVYDLRVQKSAELVNISDKDMKENVEALHAHWVTERAKVVCLRAV